MELRFIKLRPDATVPRAAHPGDAGCDLYSVEAATLAPGGRARIPTGIAIALPEGHAGLVLPRSGLADRHGIMLVNAPGLIDSGYRGELQVLLHNSDRSESFEVRPGERIAQLVVIRFEAPRWLQVSEFDQTARGDGGFGSSGV